MSFLHGSAINWFTPNILNHDLEHSLIWMTSSLALIQQLYLHFGEKEPHGVRRADCAGNGSA